MLSSWAGLQKSIPEYATGAGAGVKVCGFAGMFVGVIVLLIVMGDY